MQRSGHERTDTHIGTTTLVRPFYIMHAVLHQIAVTNVMVTISPLLLAMRVDARLCVKFMNPKKVCLWVSMC